MYHPVVENANTHLFWVSLFYYTPNWKVEVTAKKILKIKFDFHCRNCDGVILQNYCICHFFPSLEHVLLSRKIEYSESMEKQTTQNHQQGWLTEWMYRTPAICGKWYFSIKQDQLIHGKFHVVPPLIKCCSKMSQLEKTLHYRGMFVIEHFLFFNTSACMYFQ